MEEFGNMSPEYSAKRYMTKKSLEELGFSYLKSRQWGDLMGAHEYPKGTSKVDKPNSS